MKQYLWLIGTMYFAFSNFAKAECTLETVNDVDCFKCGDDCVAHVTYTDELQEDGTVKSIGTMEISGTGYMDGGVAGGWYEKDVPWRSIRNQIHNIKIEEGIKSIGFNAFWGFSQLTNIELPQSLEKIRPGGLQRCISLQTLVLPENILLERESLETTGLTDLVIPEGAKLTSNALQFDNDVITPIITLYCPTDMKDTCEKAIAYREGNAKVEEYKKMANGRYLVAGKQYLTAEDLQKGKVFTPKLIYTVEEAMKATEKGTKFHVFLTYK